MPLREDPAASISTSDPQPGETGVSTTASGDDIDSDWWTFDSTRVSEASYNRDTDQLFVRFVRPVPGMVEYVYEGVPSNVWRNFRRSQSPGKFVNRVLNQFDYHRTPH